MKYVRGAAIAMFPTIGRAISFYIRPAMRKFRIRVRILFDDREPWFNFIDWDTRCLNSWLTLSIAYMAWEFFLELIVKRF